VRVCLKSKEIAGFATRDLGGVRLHRPTLERTGVTFEGVPPGGPTLTDDFHAVLHKIHHALIQVHLSHFLYVLGLEPNGGWRIVREELAKALDLHRNETARLVYEFFMAETMAFKCFLVMRLKGIYRDVSL
jgi:siderophore synthetase component